jgi:heptosyltransferase-2/heptosyltransferase-3
MTPVPPPDRVVVFRPDHLGDVLLTGPMLAAIRSRWPAADVTLVVGPWCADVADRLPGVDHVETLPFPYFDRRPRASLLDPYRRLITAARALRHASAAYDVAVIARDDDRWSALLARASGIPIVAGHATRRTRWVLTRRLPAARRPAHVAAAGVALIDALAGDRAAAGATGRRATPPSPAAHPMSFRLTDDDHARAAALLGSDVAAATARDSRAPRAPLVVHPGSGSPIKRWTPASWGAAVRALTAPDEPVVLTGGPDEVTLVAEVAAALGRPVIDLAGRTDLPTLAAVFARCRAVAGPDSGPLHLAVAVGTPTVHLFGPADAARFGPWGAAERHAVVAGGLVCAPCGRLDWPDLADHPCVRIIEVGRVVAAMRRVVGG